MIGPLLEEEDDDDVYKKGVMPCRRAGESLRQRSGCRAPIVSVPISGWEMDPPGRSLVLTVGHRFQKAIRISRAKIDTSEKFLEWHSSLGSGLV